MAAFRFGHDSPPRTNLRVAFVNASAGHFGWSNARTRSTGQMTTVPAAQVFSLEDEDTDTDGDGLYNLAEYVIGTDPANPDSDGGGILDGAELQQGTDPLDDLIVQTGIIASADTPGSAQDVCVSNDSVVVADGSSGISVFNVFNGMDPAVVARVDTPGEALAVTCSGNLVTVADSTGGLPVVDITDPPAAAIVHQLDTTALGGNTVTVAFAGGTVFVGTNTGIISQLALDSGLIIDQLDLGVAGHDLVVDGEWLYVLTPGTLHTVWTLDFPLQVTGSATVGGIPTATTGRMRLAVGSGVAYMAHRLAYDTYEVADPANPLLTTPTVTAQAAWKHVVPNGSGIGLAAVGPTFDGSASDDVSIYDVGDPLFTDVFVTTYPTPGTAQAVTIYNGLGYVANGNSGLQVVNYLAYDALGIRPDVSLNVAPNQVQHEEGSVILVQATVTDDVQVRNVELLVDGEVVQTDGGFPFQFFLTVPNYGAAGIGPSNMFNVALRATDTGGNGTTTVAQTLEVVQDIFPPTVTASTPLANETYPPEFFDIYALTASFSEPVDAATVNASSVQLIGTGPDTLFDTADDVTFPASVSLLQNNRVVAVAPDQTLPNTDLRLTVRAAIVTDSAGNALDDDGDGTGGDDFTLTITVSDGTTIFWDGGGDGTLWHDPLNWSTDTLPVATDVVLIDVPGSNPTIIRNQAVPAAVQELRSEERMEISNYPLTITGHAQFNGDLVVGPFPWPTAFPSLAINGTADVAGTLSLNNQSRVGGSGTLTLTGHLDWTFGDVLAPLTLIVDPTATVSITTASSQFLFGAMHNYGAITFDSQGNGGAFQLHGAGRLHNMPTGVITLVGTRTFGTIGNAIPPYPEFTNDGTLRHTGGGTLSFWTAAFSWQPLFTNNGLIESDQGTIHMPAGRPITNADTISISAGAIVSTLCAPLNFAATSVLQIHVAGAAPGQYGVASMGCTPSLDGTLSLVVDPSYIPILGETLDVMTWASHTGSFATVTGLDLGGGLQFDVAYLADRLSLTVVAGP